MLTDQIAVERRNALDRGGDARNAVRGRADEREQRLGRVLPQQSHAVEAIDQAADVRISYR